MANYRLTNETQQVGDNVLYRIEALEAIAELDVYVGTKGGWVQGEHNLSKDGKCWVADDATVSGNALVTGDALVADTADITGSATIMDNAKVFGDATISGDVTVSENAIVYDNADIGGSIKVYRDARVFGDFAGSGNYDLSEGAYIRTGSDVLSVTGIYNFTMYRTEYGHSPLPERLPETLVGLVEESLDRWKIPLTT